MSSTRPGSNRAARLVGPMSSVATHYVPGNGHLLPADGLNGQDQPRQLPRCGRRDDLAAKPPLGQQRQPAAVIKMRMGQQDVVDAGRIESERLRVFLVQFAATLVQSAVDQDPLPGTLDHVTGTGDAAVGAVKR